jgi:hypothetical protein
MVIILSSLTCEIITITGVLHNKNQSKSTNVFFSDSKLLLF